MKRVADHELRRLRNDIKIDAVIERLNLPTKHWEGRSHFLCPRCNEFHSATNPKTNLARCFRCQLNFNPIDLVMVVERVDFIGAVRYLQRCFPDNQIA